MTYLNSSRSFDPLRPGEQWFYYWKTSAVLWESKILQFSKDEILFIPIYWGFHAESSEEWDFGRMCPERDLVRLAQILTQHHRKACWILPLTPAPFFPNGGLPSFCSRNLSVDRNGVHLAVFNHELVLHKMYSFFVPKVFQFFSEFISHFQALMSKNKINFPVWGGDFYYSQSGEYFSFFEDRSVAFDQSFSRFLKNAEKYDASEMSPGLENDLKQEYTLEVRRLFSSTAENSLSALWSGIQKIAVLGGSPIDTILRALPNPKSQLDYAKDLFNHLTNSYCISSALLSEGEKKELLNWMLLDNMGPSEIETKYKFRSIKAQLNEDFDFYGFIDIFTDLNKSRLSSLGLLNFLELNFRSLYQIHSKLPFYPEWLDAHQDRIKIFSAQDLDRIQFSQMLKLFMMGQRLILDKSNLEEDLEKKLQIFLVENKIEVQVVNFVCPVWICQLGEGVLIIFEGDKLQGNILSENFWTEIFKFFRVTHLKIKMDPDVFGVWKIRATSSHELSYMDVRRINIYNPTSYKKSVNIKTQKHFAFMKMVDPVRASVRSTVSGVDVELLPNGKISLDFGHYEDI